MPDEPHLCTCGECNPQAYSDVCKHELALGELGTEYRHRAHDSDGNLIWAEGRARRDGCGDFYTEQAFREHFHEQSRLVGPWSGED